jgi:hypothetical protein
MRAKLVKESLNEYGSEGFLQEELDKIVHQLKSEGYNELKLIYSQTNDKEVITDSGNNVELTYFEDGELQLYDDEADGEGWAVIDNAMGGMETFAENLDGAIEAFKDLLSVQ